MNKPWQQLRKVYLSCNSHYDYLTEQDLLFEEQLLVRAENVGYRYLG